MPPLRGLGSLATCCYKHSVATRLKRVFEVFKISASYPVRLGMQIAFGRVRRDALRIWASTPQKPNLPGRG